MCDPADEPDDDLPLAALAEKGGAFAFLADEPDLYSEADIVGNIRFER